MELCKGPSTKKAAMSESQIVEMPDGTLRVYARSTGSKIAEAVSLDGGKHGQKRRMYRE